MAGWDDFISGKKPSKKSNSERETWDDYGANNDVIGGALKSITGKSLDVQPLSTFDKIKRVPGEMLDSGAIGMQNFVDNIKYAMTAKRDNSFTFNPLNLNPADNIKSAILSQLPENDNSFKVQDAISNLLFNKPAIEANRDATNDIKSRNREFSAGETKFDNFVGDAVRKGLNSLASQVPAMAASAVTRSSAPMLGYAGTSTYLDKKREALEKGYNEANADRIAQIHGGTEVLTEFLPAGRYVDDVVKGSGLVKSIVRQVVPDVPGEMVAATVQNAVDTSAGLGGATKNDWDGYINNLPDSLGEAAIGSLVGSSVQGGAAHLANRAASGFSQLFQQPAPAQQMQQPAQAAQQVQPKQAQPKQPANQAAQAAQQVQPKQAQPKQPANQAAPVRGLDALGHLISRGEGGYNSVNLGGAKGYAAGTRNLSEMTVGDILRAHAAGDFNAVGKYQMIKPTFADGVRALGLSGNEKFTPQLQERFFKDFLLHKAGGGAVTRYLQGKGSLEAAQIGLAQEWRSFADPRTGKTYADKGASANKASISAQESARILQAVKNGTAVDWVNLGSQSQDSVLGGESSIFDNSQNQLNDEMDNARDEQEQMLADSQDALDEKLQEMADAQSELDDKISNIRNGTDSEVEVSGKYEPTQWQLMEADELNPTMEKADNQLRDRTRLASELQVDGIANNLDFRKLGDSPMMDYGAPTLGLDGKIIGGNGRVAGITRAYASGKANDYKTNLAANAGRFGFTPDDVAGMKSPVLVRRFKNNVDTTKAAIASNEGGGLVMSTLEQAKADGIRLPDLKHMQVNEDGNINTASNRDFIRAFIAQLPVNQQAAFAGSDGQLSQQGVARLRNAVLYKAYGDTPQLQRMIESTDQGSKNIANALTQAAPRVSTAKNDIDQGDIHSADISQDMVDAVTILEKIRADGGSLREYLAQRNMFGDDLSIESRKLIQFFNDNIKSATKIREFINAYYDALEAQGSPKQDDIFGDTINVDKNQLLDKVINERTGQQSDTEAEATARLERSTGEDSKPTEQRSETQGGTGGSTQESQPAEELSNDTTFDFAGERPSEAAQAAHDEKLRLEAEQADKQDNAPRAESFTLTGSDRDADVAAAHGQESMFSKAKAKTTGNTVTAIQASISKMLGIDAAKSLPNVSIMQTATPDIVSKLENGQLSIIGSKQQNDSIQGAYDGKTGRIFLFADNIKQGEENAVLLHEIFHKRGREVLGDNYSRLKSFVDGWENSKAGTVEKRIFDTAKSRADKSGEDGARYDDELIAYAIEEAVNTGIEPSAANIGKSDARGFLARVMQLFSNAMKKLVPGYKGKFDGQDLVHVAYGLAGMEVQNAEQQGDSDGVSYSKGNNEFTIEPETKSQSFERQQVNSMNRLTNVEKQLKDNGITLSVDASSQAVAYHGRLTERLHDFREKNINQLLKKMAAVKTSADRVDWYLLARHAIERNAQIAKINDQMPDGGSGMLNQQARDLLAGKDVTMTVQTADKHGKVEKQSVTVTGFNANELAQMRDIGAMVDAITAENRKLTVGYGLESAQDVAGWTGMYKHYVPLAGIVGANEFMGVAGAQSGFSVRGGQKRAMGRSSVAPNILEQVLRQREDVLMRGEKNLVARAFVVNTKGAMSGADMPMTASGQPLYELNPADMKPYIKSGKVEWRSVPDTIGRNVVTARHNGKDIVVRVNDAALAEAVRNLDAPQLGGLLKWWKKGTSTLSMVYTGASPLFWGKAFIRDLWTVATVGQRFGLTGSTLRNLPKALQVSFASEFNNRRGGSNENANFREFRLAGGRTGFIESHRDLTERRQAIEKQLLQMGDLTLQSSPVKIKEALKGAFEWMTYVGSSFESAVRFAAYQAAKGKGLDNLTASNIAKEITINFNRKGASKEAQVLNTLFVFYNASVQGVSIQAKAMKDKRVLLSLVPVAALGVLGQAMALASVDDDDERELLLNNPTFQRDRVQNILIPTGNNERPYLKIPLPPDLYWVAGIGASIADGIYHDRNSVARGLEALGMGFGKSFLPPPVGDIVAANPLKNGGKTVALAAPSLVKPLAQSALNVSFTGTPLMPENTWDDTMPDSQKMWRRTENSWASSIAIGMSNMTGGDKHVGGMIDVSPESIKNTVQAYTGGIGAFLFNGYDAIDNPKKGMLDAPIVSDFFASPDALERGNSSRVSQIMAEAKDMKAQIKAYAKDGNNKRAAEVTKQMNELTGGDMSIDYIRGAYSKRENAIRKADPKSPAIDSLAERRAAADKQYLKGRDDRLNKLFNK